MPPCKNWLLSAKPATAAPRFRILYIFFIRHERRELIHFNVTASPTAAWIWCRLLATPWGPQLKHLIHDRDAVYGDDFDRRLASLGIAGIRTPPRAPKANAVAERIVRTIRTECLDHLIVIDERHLRGVLTVTTAIATDRIGAASARSESPWMGRVIPPGRVIPSKPGGAPRPPNGISAQTTSDQSSAVLPKPRAHVLGVELRARGWKVPGPPPIRKTSLILWLIRSH